jgi:hypothetical protein
MSFRDPEDWMPEYGLSQMDCIKASVAMAEFCILAAENPEVSPNEFKQTLGSFVFAASMSCKESQLQEAVRSDLENAGLDGSAASAMAEKLSEQTYLESVASGDFIYEDLPAYGLRKTKRFTGVNERKFVHKIIKMSGRP